MFYATGGQQNKPNIPRPPPCCGDFINRVFQAIEPSSNHPSKRQPWRNNVESIQKKVRELERLQEQYSRLSEESFKLSRVNRRESDQKAAEADAIMRQIEAMQDAVQ